MVLKAAPDDEEKAIKANERYQYDIKWIQVIIKSLPGYFHEIHKALPAVMDYVVEIDFQSDAFIVVARVGNDDGTGAINNATYQIHTADTFLLIDYKSMGKEEDLKLEKRAFSIQELHFDTFDKLRLVFSETFLRK